MANGLCRLTSFSWKGSLFLLPLLIGIVLFSEPWLWEDWAGAEGEVLSAVGM